MKADRIALGLRIGQMVDPAFFVAWTEALLGAVRPGDKVLMPAVHLPHACACNVLAARFLRTACDALLLIDDDMVFRPGDIGALRATDSPHGILSGLYTSRREPIRPVAMRWNGKGFAGVPLADFHGVIDVDVVGFGFTLISRAAVESVANSRTDGLGVFRWTNSHGEDGEFCTAAAGQGYRVGVNCDVVVGHRVAYTARWNAADMSVEMVNEDFGMFEKG